MGLNSNKIPLLFQDTYSSVRYIVLYVIIYKAENARTSSALILRYVFERGATLRGILLTGGYNANARDAVGTCTSARCPWLNMRVEMWCECALSMCVLFTDFQGVLYIRTYVHYITEFGIIS